MTRRFGLLLAIGGILFAQAPSIPVAAKDGAALAVEAPDSVKDFVSIQAALLPHAITRELFNKNIADNYVAVFVNIGNRSRSASLVMEGIYIDYSKWALSGSNARRESINSRIDNYSTATWPAEVSSVESRVVRGHLEERQPKTARNWIARSLRLTGAIAAGYVFAFQGVHATEIAQGIAAFNGVGIPGFERFWPDSFIQKLNRISDFGYRANRIVPRESSDIFLVFFPIDRFLTAGLKKAFIDYPAVFFNPGLALVDDTIPDSIKRMIEKTSAKSLKELRDQLPDMILCHSDRVKHKDRCEASQLLRATVASISLSSVAIVLDGSMVVDLATVPAIVESAEFTSGTDKNQFFTTVGDGKELVIKGRNLSGSKVQFTSTNAIDSPVRDDRKSTDEQLTVKFTFKAAIPREPLIMKVVKEAKDGRVIESSPFSIKVDYDEKLPTVKPNADVDANGKLTIEGANLSGVDIALRVDQVQPPGEAQWFTRLISADGRKVEADLNKNQKGCFRAQLFVAGTPLTASFRIPHAPKITNALRDGKKVTITGTELFSLEKCDLQLQVKILATGSTAAVGVANLKFAADAKSATFELNDPQPAAGSKIYLFQGPLTIAPVDIKDLP
jgi:hypothetical protein